MVALEEYGRGGVPANTQWVRSYDEPECCRPGMAMRQKKDVMEEVRLSILQGRCYLAHTKTS